jgi:hypothetical protein
LLTRRNEIAIGNHIQADSCEASKAYGVTVNPKKSALVNFTLENQVLELAKD